MSEFILENPTDRILLSIDSLFDTGEPFIFADILAQEFGVEFEIRPNGGKLLLYLIQLRKYEFILNREHMRSMNWLMKLLYPNSEH